MPDSAIPYLNPSSPSSNLDAESATTSQGIVLRERVVIAGPQTNSDGHAFVTAPGTAVQLPTNTCRYVVITADQANSDVIVIGGSEVVAGASGDTGRNRRGIPLFSNQQVTLAIDNTNQIWVDAVSAGDGINFAFFA